MKVNYKSNIAIEIINKTQFFKIDKEFPCNTLSLSLNIRKKLDKYNYCIILIRKNKIRAYSMNKKIIKEHGFRFIKYENFIKNKEGMY